MRFTNRKQNMRERLSLMNWNN